MHFNERIEVYVQEFGNVDAIVDAVAGRIAPGPQHYLVMSNGGFGGIHERLISRLEAKA